MLAWKGSHLDAQFSPDGKVSCHVHAGADIAWLAAGGCQGHADVGYSGRVTRWPSRPAASGLQPPGRSNSSSAVCLERRPMGKQPRMVAPYEKRVAAVACHPKQDIIATGFEMDL